MSKLRKFPDNVIPVNFNRKSTALPDRKTLSSNPFAMFVDENSLNPDEFSKALLASVKTHDDLVFEIEKENQNR
ncbi:hypothetical protein [Desulfobacula toluolica]|uniref:Uncharacterized protein n=1 Tax=Desulfobacula toluolica (strain DSM 7467 / Tol2) TaxID=651182 RepID=K0N3K9_DESTT|nr:hypothetical protein [Desulfobacula toluolica]CCK78709.1 uncharacterized protein TOL2_C05410 [Desulfobacula toluolica Tol2]